MRNQKKLILDQLDRKLKPLKALEEISVPNKGWINAIRSSLNMTLEQLGRKLNITKQGVRSLEESEAAGSVTIRSLRESARAMDMKLVYAFIPADGSLNELVERKARELAKTIVHRTNQNMLLEDQGTNQEQLNSEIEGLTMEIKYELKRRIWD